MVLLHVHGGLAMGAHGIHYAVVGLGILGLVALLSPQFLAESRLPRDDHEARVWALRAALDQSAPTGPAAGTGSATALDPITPATLLATPETGYDAPVLTAAQRVLLPLAVVSSTAAAGVHAAVGPEHLRESLLFGLFFGGSAVAQLVWSAAVVARGSRALLLGGLLGNVSLLVLWATTRTMGLPFGLLPEPEAIGPWDLACGAWELVVVCCCTALLQSRDPLPRRLPSWRLWHPVLPTYVAASVLLLVALAFSGAGA